MARQKRAQAVTQNPDTAGLPKKQKRMLGVIALTAVLTIVAALLLGGYGPVNYPYEAKPHGEASATIF